MKASKWKSLSCWMGALAATAAIAAPSIVPPESKDRDQRLNGGAESALIVSPEAGEVVRSPGNMSAMPARGLRADPPVPGGGCQANGDFTDAAGTTIGYNINSTAFMRADNFRPAGTGAVSLTAVSWTGWAHQGTAPALVAPVAANQPAQFVVTIFNDANGLPGTIIGTAQTVTPTRTASTQTVQPGNTALALQDYTVTLPTAVPLTAQTCYWIEIRPVTLVAGVSWFWRPSLQGDGVNFRRTTTATPYPTNGIRTGDFSFCTNLPLVPQNTATSCAVNSTMACAAPGTVQTNCQVYDGTGTANFSTKAPVYGGTPAGNCIGTAVTFRSADNFTINAPGNINSGCFQGVIVLGAANAAGCPAQTLPAAVDDSFDISVFTDAGSPTSGVPGTLIATRTVTPSDGALTRGGEVTSAFANSFNWSYDLSTHSQGPIVLPTSGCYWIEIVYNSQTVRWAWFLKSNARPTGIADNFRQTQASTVNAGAYNLQSQQFNADFSWCMSISEPLVRSTSCVAVPTQTNTACATATTLPLGGTPVFGQNLAEGTQIPFSCTSRVPNFNGLWYRVVGNGQDVTISTCNTGTNPLAAATNFDTVISVFCTRGTGGTGGAGTECTAGLVCIGTNDDGPLDANGADACVNAPGVGASSLTFPTFAGQSYLVYVYGFEAGNGAIDTGFFYVGATASGAASNPPAVACSGLRNCEIDIPAGAIQEADACDVASTNSNCGAAAQLPLGSFGTGQVSNNAATRDFDYWRLPDVNDASGSQWFKIDYRSEFPGFLQVGRGLCTGTAVPLIQFGVTACSSANDFYINVPNGEFYLNISVNSFDGLPCFVGGAGNRYWLQVTPVAEVGACCLGATCTVTVRNNAAVGGAEPFDCATLQGVFIGNGSLCIPDPCDPAGGNPPNSVVGSCCLGFGDCAITVETGCTGGTFLAAGVCTPNTCAAPLVTCCFASGTCLISADAAACTSAGGTAQATLRACTPNACPAPTGACCTTTFTCSITTQAACTGGATWLGALSVCTPVNCAPTGGCCAPILTCITATEAACVNAGSTWLGAGVVCSAVNCAPLGACCSAAGVCSITTQLACADTVGWQNGILSCTPNPCPTTSVVCCRGVTCAVIAPVDCTAPAGVGISQFAGTTCVGQSAIVAGCCYADFNKSGVKDVADIFAFLSAWFANSPFSDVGGDGTGTRDVSDIFQFLSAWFAGCT